MIKNKIKFVSMAIFVAAVIGAFVYFQFNPPINKNLIRDEIISKFDEAKSSKKAVVYYFSKSQHDRPERQKIHLGKARYEFQNDCVFIQVNGLTRNESVKIDFVNNDLISKCSQRLCIVDPSTSRVKNMSFDGITPEKFRKELKSFINK